jgi:hypothetical protein
MSERSASPDRFEAQLGVASPGNRSWQRVGWLLLCLLILLAASGALGDGPLARATLSGPGGLRIDYPRIARRLGSTPIQILVPAAPAPRERLQLDVIGLPGSEPMTFSPAPLRERAIPGGLRVELAIRGEGPVAIDLVSQPQAPGRRAIQLAVDGGKPVSIRQLVLP